MVFDSIKTWRGVRVYQDKLIPKNVFEELIDYGQLAVTTIECEHPRKFIVITNKKVKNWVEKNTGNNGNFVFHSSACIAVFSKEMKCYVGNGTAAIQNSLLTAWAYDIDTDQMTGDKKNYTEEVRKCLGPPDIPNDYKLVSLIHIGHSADQRASMKVRDITVSDSFD